MPARPEVCLSCTFKRNMNTGASKSVFCAKNSHAKADDTESPPVGLDQLDHSRYIGILHVLNGKESVTLNPDFEIPANCSYTFEHLMADQDV